MRIARRVVGIALVAGTLAAGAALPEAAAVADGDDAAAPDAAAPWGDAVGGLRCRVRAPGDASQGDVVAVALDVAASTGGTATATLPRDADDAARRAVLELVSADGRRVEVRPHDPDAGMPPGPPSPDEGSSSAAPSIDAPRTFALRFPLARAWDDIAPGTWTAQVRLDVGARPSSAAASSLVAPGFALRIAAAAPREEVVRLPTSLRIEGDAVVFDDADVEPVRVPRRNGFAAGWRLTRDGADVALSGGAEVPALASPVDRIEDGSPSSGAAYTVTLFETADAPEHMWHPGPGAGSYRTLWERTFRAARIEAAPPRSLAVRVAREDGSPEAGATIELMRVPPAKPFSPLLGETAADGTVRFDGLEPGRYRASLHRCAGVAEGWLHWDACAHERRFEVREDETAGRSASFVAPESGAFDVVADARGFDADEKPAIDVFRRYPDGQWRRGANDSSWKPDRGADGRIVWHVRDVPVGTFRVRLRSHGRSTSIADVRVGARADAHAGPQVVHVAPGVRPEPFDLVYAGPPLDRSESLNVNPLDATCDGDVGHGRFTGSPPRATVAGVGPGRYLLILRRARLAMRLDVAAGSPREVAVTVPADLAEAPDASFPAVRVVLLNQGVPDAHVMAALVPASDDPLPPGRWLRFRHANGEPFDHVPPGDWDALVLDGVFGERVGLPEGRLVRRIHVDREDVTVTFER